MKQSEAMQGTEAPGQGLRLLVALTATLLCYIATSAQALPDDQDQPIHITADQALRDENRGHTVYSGNVRLVQGSMELDADRLTIWHTEEDADKFVARGKPARMRQQPEPDQDLVHAHAETITYLRNKQQVNLKTNARIEQNGDVITGDSIDYLIERQLIKAKASQRKEDERVSVVIQPSTQQGERRVTPATAPEKTTEGADTDATSAPEAPEPGQETVQESASAQSPEEQDSEDGGPSGATESD